MSEEKYRELHPGEIIQPGDEFCVSIGQDRWHRYPTRRDGSPVSASSLARRPIAKAAEQLQTQPIAYEEIPGSRTTQDAVSQPQRERIAYEELRPGDVIQQGDEWRSECGRWQQFALMPGKSYQVRDSLRVRRPYKISTIQEIGDALASTQKAATQLQGERDEARLAIAQVKAEFNNQVEVLAEVRVDEKRLFDDLELLRSEYVKLQGERDEARAEMDTVKGDRMNLREALAAEQRAHKVTMASGLQACSERDELREALAAEQLAHKVTMISGLEACKERDEALAEVAKAREGVQGLLKTIAENADQFADHTIKVVRERDEARAERDRLQEVVGNLYSEPTARQVQGMLRTWATELDWSAGCFDSVGREQIDTIQKTLVAVMERIEGMIHPEGGTDDN